MKKAMNLSSVPKAHSWLGILLLMVILCLVSIDAAHAQKSDRGKEKQTNGRSFLHKARSNDQSRNAACDRLPNRTLDGTCNNITSSATVEWGASDIALFRDMHPAYGAPDFFNDLAGSSRVSPRAISNLIVAQAEDLPSPRNLSSLVFTWGQFIDHDIDLTPEGHTEYAPVLLPADEPLFTAPIPFFRSEPLAGTGLDKNREQQNLITSWLDASQVYGSEEERASWLRTFSQGKLKTSAGDFLPYNTLDGNLESDFDPEAPSMAGDDGGTVKVFVAGDVRANEQPGLTVLHTLFVREHNRICDELVREGSNNDERNYQIARKRVGGYMQSITYNGFLPALGIELNPYSGYHRDVRPDISNIFATAAYRLGHTMVTDEIPLLDNRCNPVGDGSLSLLESFFNPEIVPTYGLDPLLKGLANQKQQKVDTKIVDDLRNFLFPVPGTADFFGLDLASLNIQRGRDHGLPDYNSVRMHYTGLSIDDFDDITSDPELQASLEAAYGNIYDMDLWVGLLSENPISGSSVGITLYTILANQFEQIRDGDFYFYRNDPGLSNRDRDEIRNTTLGDLIERNTRVTSLQNNVFFANNCIPPVVNPGNGPGRPGGSNRPGRPGRPDGRSTDFENRTDGGLGINQMLVSPNPTDGRVNLNILLAEPQENLRISLSDLAGRSLYKEEVSGEDKAVFLNLDLTDYPPGVYWISVESGTLNFSEKIVKQ